MPVITEGTYELLDADNEQVYTYLRKGQDETLVVVANFTDETVAYHVDDKVQAEESRLVISNYADAPETFAHEMTLKPYGAYVYSVK